MSRRFVARRTQRSYLAPFNRGHLCHAVPLLDPRDILHAGDTAQALCGLVPRKGWDWAPLSNLTIAEQATCLRCRRLLPRESAERP